MTELQITHIRIRGGSNKFQFHFDELKNTSSALISKRWPFPGDSTITPFTDTDAPVDNRSTSE